MRSFSPIEDLDSCRYLCMDSISAPETNSLRFVLSEGIASARTETLVIGDVGVPDLRPIEVTEASRHFEVVRDSYISFVVRDEFYCSWDKDEESTGNSFRVYSKSKFLDFVASSTSACTNSPEPITHYEIIC